MNYLKQHGIGDFLNHVFTLAPRMWKSVLPLAAIVFLPAGIAYVMGFAAMGSSMESISVLRSSESADIWTAMMPLIGAFAWLIGAAVWYSLAYSLINAVVTDQTISLIRAEENDGKALQRALSHNALTLLGQSLIIGCIMMVILLIIYGVAIGVILLVISQFSHEWNRTTISLVSMGLSFGIMMLAMPVVYWFITKVSVAPQVAIVEKTGGFAGLGRSFQLVRGSSWRVFGVTFLVSMIFGFALGILTGPIIFIFVLPGYLEFLRSAMSGAGNSPETMAHLFKSMSWGIGISFYIQSIALGILWPIYQSLMYTDLKIRRGEWQEVIPPPVVQASTIEPVIIADNHE